MSQIGTLTIGYHLQNIPQQLSFKIKNVIIGKWTYWCTSYILKNELIDSHLNIKSMNSKCTGIIDATFKFQNILYIATFIKSNINKSFIYIFLEIYIGRREYKNQWIITNKGSFISTVLFINTTNICIFSPSTAKLIQ